MDFWGIGTYAAITVICYLAGAGVKATAIDNKWIPVIVGVLGAILGAAGFYLVAEFPATDVLNGIATGIVSGLTATGVNQIGKQLSEKE